MKTIHCPNCRNEITIEAEKLPPQSTQYLPPGRGELLCAKCDHHIFFDPVNWNLYDITVSRAYIPGPGKPPEEPAEDKLRIAKKAFLLLRPNDSEIGKSMLRHLEEDPIGFLNRYVIPAPVAVTGAAFIRWIPERKSRFDKILDSLSGSRF